MTAPRPQAFTHAPAQRFEIAPYLSEPSGLLRFLAFYFTVTGSVALVLALLGLALKLAGSPSIPWSAGLIAFYGVNAAGLMFTGTQLRTRSKVAWYCGWLACLTPLYSIVTGHAVATQVMFAMVSFGLLWAVRREFE
jgi:hypothetical protein